LFVGGSPLDRGKMPLVEDLPQQCVQFGVRQQAKPAVPAFA
jgi:hypothetical protein